MLIYVKEISIYAKKMGTPWSNTTHPACSFLHLGANNTRRDGRAFSPSQKRQQCGRQSFGRTQIVSQIKLRRQRGGAVGGGRKGETTRQNEVIIRRRRQRRRWRRFRTRKSQ